MCIVNIKFKKYISGDGIVVMTLPSDVTTHVMHTLLTYGDRNEWVRDKVMYNLSWNNLIGMFYFYIKSSSSSSPPGARKECIYIIMSL